MDLNPEELGAMAIRLRRSGCAPKARSAVSRG
jgi:hypothetical protein